MTDLERKREELAERHSGILEMSPGHPYEPIANARFSAFQAGFDAAVAELTKLDSDLKMIGAALDSKRGIFTENKD